MHAEIERTEALQGDRFQARLRADNGEIVWWTELYESREAAERALELLGEWFGPDRAVAREYIGFSEEAGGEG